MSITPALVDLIIYIGVDFSENWIFSDNAGNLTDLTGSSAVMTIYAQDGYPTPIATLTTNNGGIIFNYQDDVLCVASPFLAASATNALEAGCGFYNFEISSPGGFINRFLQGCVSIQV